MLNARKSLREISIMTDSDFFLGPFDALSKDIEIQKSLVTCGEYYIRRQIGEGPRMLDAHSLHSHVPLEGHRFPSDTPTTQLYVSSTPRFPAEAHTDGVDVAPHWTAVYRGEGAPLPRDLFERLPHSPITRRQTV